jgi:hypothetical protein
MIADQAVRDASPVLDFAGKVQAFLASAKAAAGDGLTWAEFGELLVALLRLSVQTLDATLTLTGPEKKILVLEAVSVLFDTFSDRCVPIVVWPVWMLARPAIRALILALSSGAAEQLLSLVRSPA